MQYNKEKEQTRRHPAGKGFAMAPANDFSENAKPLGVKEDPKFIKWCKKIFATSWFEKIEIGFIMAIYALPVALIVYVLIFFFSR